MLEAHLGPSEYAQSGERVVRCQQSMQAAGDILLGWSRFDQPGGRSFDFYLRQLWDGKGSANVDDMSPSALAQYATACGGALALGHARSADPAFIAGYLGDGDTFDRAVQAFASAYADLTWADHEAHATAIRDGVIAPRWTAEPAPARWTGSS